MATTSIVRSSDISVEDISFSKQVKTLESGYKMVWVTYKNAPLIIQLPKMKAPFGLGKWTDEKGVVEKYSLDLSFAGKDSNEKLQATYDMFHALDEKVVDAALENSVEWFKKRYTSKEVMEALYTPIVKQPKDDKYAPTIKLPMKETAGGDFVCKVFDTNRSEINMKEIDCKGSDVQAIVQCSHVWIAGGKCGVSWKVSQLKVQPRPALTEYAFQPDEDDDEERANQGTSESDLEI
jgi:hypothetical protein